MNADASAPITAQPTVADSAADVSAAGVAAAHRTRSDGGARRTLSSVRNAARLLKAYSSREPEFGVTELADRLGLGKSTVHRLLATLMLEGLIEQDAETGRYRLGLAVHDLGGASASTDLHAAVLMPMSVLRNRTGETVHVGVLDGRGVVYVERLDSPHTLRLFVEVGRRNDAHATGTGKCLLAFLPPDRLDALLREWDLNAKTPHTITDRTALQRDLAEARRRGYAVNRHESEVGVISVAAPIRDATAQVVAAMSVAGPAERMDPALPKVSAAVREAAAIASRRLGWRAHERSSDRAPHS
ncbi:MAG: IclR family transcriptional regulator [Actinobacteria bacterium]|nr:IclR family transcriptional regulator [Actinomycetota bacterium]